MLTDAALKSLKPKDKPYKVADRDGCMFGSGQTAQFHSVTTIGCTDGARQ
jgi:hypothetical protein